MEINKTNKERITNKEILSQNKQKNFILKFFKTLSKALNSPYIFIAPYAFFFTLIIAIPVLVAAFLSITYFDMVQMPKFIGPEHFITIFTQDSIFMQHALPNTILYGVLVGPLSFIMAFFLAWMLAQITQKIRVVYTVIIYSASITGPIMMTNVWRILFSGDAKGHLNSFLLQVGWIDTPIQFLQDSTLLFIVMIFVGIWSSMGVGFLSILAGMMNLDKSIYEAAEIDGIKNRWQEIIYLTIPQMKPQLLFGAVMAIVGTFNISGAAAALSGSTPPPQYSGWFIVDHANDFGFVKYEMGYASAVTVILLLIVILFNRISYKLFGQED